MRKRIKYFTLPWQIPEEKREEVLRVCAHCTARLYLEGKPLLDSPSAPAQGVPALPAAPPSSSDAPLAKRRRTVAECVQTTTPRCLKDVCSEGIYFYMQMLLEIAIVMN